MSTEKGITYDDLIKKENIFYKYFISNTCPILILNNKSFKIVDINEKAIEFFNYSATELKKRHFYDLTAEKEQANCKSHLELHRSKHFFKFQIPLQPKAKSEILCLININDISISKFNAFAATIDTESSEQLLFLEKLKTQNRELEEQVKRMIDINRKIVNSYEHIKKQYQDLLDFQEDNVKGERHRTIGEMIEVLQDKINKPLNRIIDDVQKIQDSEKKLDSSVVKRLKLIEESAENVLRLIARIAEIKDIKKMKYIELNNS